MLTNKDVEVICAMAGHRYWTCEWNDARCDAQIWQLYVVHGVAAPCGCGCEECFACGKKEWHASRDDEKTTVVSRDG